MTARKSKDAGKTDLHDTPAVHCQHSAMVKIEDLRPHPRNPNKHGDEQIALLAKNIRHLGWRHPILVSAMSGYIVAGHARLEAAKLLNLAAVPVDAQPFASEAEEHAYLLADNRIAELADLQTAALKDLLEELDTGGFDMDLTGFVESERERLATQYHEESAADTKPPPPPKCAIVFPALVWLTQKAEIKAALEPIVEGYGGEAEWPE
jgi:ParB-like chromosome segregation protein Spo0J